MLCAKSSSSAIEGVSRRGTSWGGGYFKDCTV